MCWRRRDSKKLRGEKDSCRPAKASSLICSTSHYHEGLILYCVGDETLERIVQRGCGCVQSQVGWGIEQPGLVGVHSVIVACSMALPRGLKNINSLIHNVVSPMQSRSHADG